MTKLNVQINAHRPKQRIVDIGYLKFDLTFEFWNLNFLHVSALNFEFFTKVRKKYMASPSSIWLSAMFSLTANIDCMTVQNCRSHEE